MARKLKATTMGKVRGEGFSINENFHFKPMKNNVLVQRKKNRILKRLKM